MRHAWHKNLMEKCSNEDMRAEIFRRLGSVVSCICLEGGGVDLFSDFLEEFIDSVDFIDYFKSTWFPRLGLLLLPDIRNSSFPSLKALMVFLLFSEAWISALKSLPVATSETCAAIEYYHHQLKLRLLNEKERSVYQRADWLVDKLGTHVHSYYWLDEFSGKASFARYWKNEWKSDLTPWQQALQIPDDDVKIQDDRLTVRVKSEEDKEREREIIVRNGGSEFALCDCSWSKMGNLCKHAVKAGIILRERGVVSQSTSMVNFNKILRNILNCPPHDSLIRDHAVALAVQAKIQLCQLFEVKERVYHKEDPNRCHLPLADMDGDRLQVLNPCSSPASENPPRTDVDKNGALADNQSPRLELGSAKEEGNAKQDLETSQEAMEVDI